MARPKKNAGRFEGHKDPDDVPDEGVEPGKYGGIFGDPFQMVINGIKGATSSQKAEFINVVIPIVASMPDETKAAFRAALGIPA